MKPASAPSALKVQAVLGDHYKVLEFDAGMRTAADAAAAIGCTVAQIAKSLIFFATERSGMGRKRSGWRTLGRSRCADKLERSGMHRDGQDGLYRIWRPVL